MGWANPSSGDNATKIYHLCSMGSGLPSASKDEIVQVLAVVSKREEWAQRNVSEPRSLPEDGDLALVSKGCSWTKVSVRLLKILKHPFIINPFALYRFRCNEIIRLAGHGRSTMRMFACSRASRHRKIL